METSPALSSAVCRAISVCNSRKCVAPASVPERSRDNVVRKGGLASKSIATSSARSTTHLVEVWDSCIRIPPIQLVSSRCEDVKIFHRLIKAITRGRVADTFLLTNIWACSVLNLAYIGTRPCFLSNSKPLPFFGTGTCLKNRPICPHVLTLSTVES